MNIKINRKRFKRVSPDSLLNKFRGSTIDPHLKEVRELRRVLESYRQHVAHTGDTSFPELDQCLHDRLQDLQGDPTHAVARLEAIQEEMPHLIAAILARLERLGTTEENEHEERPLTGVRARIVNPPKKELLVAQTAALVARVLEAETLATRHGVPSRCRYLSEFLMTELTSSRLAELLERGGTREALLRRPKLYLQELVGELEMIKNQISHMRT